MTQEQKLSIFILGLEGQLAEEVNALRPTSLADALIRAKAKLLSFKVAEERKRTNPYPTTGLFRPQKVSIPDHKLPNSGFSNPRVQKPQVQPVKVNALPVNQSGRQIQCYGCQQWGHKKADCPNKGNNKKNVRPSLPPQEEVFNNRNKKSP